VLLDEAGCLGGLTEREGLQEGDVGEFGVLNVNDVVEEVGHFGANGTEGETLEEHGSKEVGEAFAGGEVDGDLMEFDVALVVEVGGALASCFFDGLEDFS